MHAKLLDKFFKMISSYAKTLKWVKHEQLFWSFLLFGSRHCLEKSWCMWQLLDKVFKMISSWAQTLKWVKHVVYVTYQSHKYVWNYGTSFLRWFQVRTIFLNGSSIWAIILVIFVIWKSTLPIKVMSACENYGTSSF